MVELDGERLRLQLWDTAGQERFRRSITHHYYRLTQRYTTLHCTALLQERQRCRLCLRRQQCRQSGGSGVMAARGAALITLSYKTSMSLS